MAAPYVILGVIGFLAYIIILASFPDIHKSFFGIVFLSLGVYLLLHNDGNVIVVLGGAFILLSSFIFFRETNWWRQLNKSKSQSSLQNQQGLESKTVHTAISKEKIQASVSAKIEYKKFSSSCYNCGGLGWEYYCENCYAKAAISPDSEKYDGDLYCSNCLNDGREFTNIKEELCSVCNGTGKGTNIFELE